MFGIRGACATSKDASARGTGIVSLPYSLPKGTEKVRTTMQTSSKIASASMPAPHADSTQPRTVDELTYQVVTIAAALLLLGSLWAF